MKKCFVFIPFAYNGPCVSESGPKVIEYELKKIYNKNIFFNYEMGFDDTPNQFLKRIYKNILELEKIYDKVIVFGGNHLAILPIYNIASLKNYNSLTLDAHRDYLKNDGNLTHASFLRYIDTNNINKKIILGIRDHIKETDKFNFFSEEITTNDFRKNNNILINNLNIKYLDIDFDVLDPKIFPYTICKKENGLNFKDLINLFQKITISEIKLISFSEYVPILDAKKYGIKKIFKLLKILELL